MITLIVMFYLLFIIYFGIYILKEVLNSKNRKIVLSENQKEIIEWLIRHKQETAYLTWQFLFRERESEYPDRCIAYYDELSTKEKSDVELIIARYFSLCQRNRFIAISNVFKNLVYKD